MKIAGAVLAGGKATRYANRPKGLLRLPGGETIIEHLLGEMAAVGVEPRVICANDERLYGDFGVRVIPDLTAGNGPLGGIEAVLVDVASRADAVLFLPCDTPNITAVEIRRLCEEFRHGESGIVFAETEEGTSHPLCCVVHVRLCGEISEAVRGGRLAVIRLWKEFGAARTCFENAGRFANVNVPGEFDEIVRDVGERSSAGSNIVGAKTSRTAKGGKALEISIGVPEDMRAEFVTFLADENIKLTVAESVEGTVRITSGESKRECSESELYSKGWIKCPVARATADRLHIKYKDIGKIVDHLDIKIRECAMGCF